MKTLSNLNHPLFPSRLALLAAIILLASLSSVTGAEKQTAAEEQRTFHEALRAQSAAGTNPVASNRFDVSAEARAEVAAVDKGDHYFSMGQQVRLLRCDDEVIIKRSDKPLSAPARSAEAEIEGTLALAPVPGQTAPAGMELRRASAGKGTAARQALRGLTTVASAYPVYIDPASGRRVYVDGDVIVGLEGKRKPEEFSADWARLGLGVVESVASQRINAWLLRPLQPKQRDPLATARAVGALPGVKWAEPRLHFELQRQFIPNDLRPSQQHLHNIGAQGAATDADVDAPEAWDLSTGNNSVVIAIIDDGVDINHPDLRIQTGGYDFGSNDSNPTAVGTNGHGTSCAGVAAAIGNNGAYGAGIAYGCKILPIKIADDTGRFTNVTALANAISYAADRADVLSNSWGGGSPSSLIEEAITDATQNGRGGKGCPVFFAAGNEASHWDFGGGRLRIPVGQLLGPGTFAISFAFVKNASVSASEDLVKIDDVVLLAGDGYTHLNSPLGTNGRQDFEGTTFPPADWFALSVTGTNFWSRSSTNPFTGTGGNFSARSGPISHNQVTELITPLVTLTGSEELAFHAYLASEADTDPLDDGTVYDGLQIGFYSSTGQFLGKVSPANGFRYASPQSGVAFPASATDAIAVGASTDRDRRSDYSRYGTKLDFVAPSNGGWNDIATLDPLGTVGREPFEYTAAFGGTSSACPLAAGVGALMISANPNLTAAQIRSLMRSTCDPIGGVTYSGGRNTFYGSGRINARAAVAAAINAAGTPPTIGSFTPASGAAGAAVTITGTNFTGVTAVTFNGTSATIGSSTATQIQTTVPSGAATGPIRVTTAGGTATSATNFTVNGGGNLMAAISVPGTGQSYSSLSQAAGTASGTGLDSVFVELLRMDSTGTLITGYYNWANSIFDSQQSVDSFTQATGTTNWTQALPALPAGKYTLFAFAFDTAGNFTDPPAGSAFTITGGGGNPPTISNFTPASGAAGTVVTITGTNFTGVTAVTFNGTNAAISSSTATQIQTAVPGGATTGPIRVTTPAGTATSVTNFTVSGGGLANLAPHQPAGWSDKIVISKETGTNTDSTPLSPTDQLYMDFAVINNGTGATTALFFIEVYVDDAVNPTETFQRTLPMDAGFVASAQDYLLGTLAAGTHTIRVKVDSTNVIAESNEADNEYTRTVTITSGGTPPAITGFTPASGAVGTAVTITGTNFTGVTSVTFNNITATISSSTATQIQTTVPSGSSTGLIRVTTPAGTATSATSFTVTTPPTITTHPASTTIVSAQTATLSVIATGPALTYQWFQGPSGTTTTPVGTDSASFTTPALTATTSYWVRVTNASGSTNSNTATVTVTPAPPMIATQPASTTIVSGQTAALSVVATGSALTYQWFQGPSGTTTTPVGTDSASFTTPALTATTSYWVRVTNAGGSINSNTATVTVAVPPQVFATQSSTGYSSPGNATVSGQFSYPAGSTLLSLSWRPQLPNGWTLVSVSGDGSPEMVNGQIAFLSSSLPNPVNFSYSVTVPAGQSGNQNIAAVAEHWLAGQPGPGTIRATPDPLVIAPGFHAGDFTRDWVIGLSEINRMLAYWRQQAFHADSTQPDGYAPGAGATTLPYHSADYLDPRWQLSLTEINRVLAYWRALGYHRDVTQPDGFAPGLPAPASMQLEKPALAVTASATHSGPQHYVAGQNLTISTSFAYTGTLQALGWQPVLPGGWTVTAASGSGNPELQGGEIVWTSSTLPPSPVTLTYTVNVPPGTTGSHQVRSKVNYYIAGGAFVDEFASPDPLALSAAPPKYNLAIQAVPPDGGTVNANPLPGIDGKYDAGTVVTLTSVAGAGYHLTSWNGDASGANNSVQVTMNADRNVTANFALNTYSLTYAAGPNGTVNGTSPQTVSHGASGTPVTAVPAPHYFFVNWSDGSTANPRTDTNVTASLAVTANFQLESHTVTYTAGPHGTVQGALLQTIPHGEGGTTVTAVPDPGYFFVNWSDGLPTNPRTEANVTASITVTANFAESRHTLALATHPSSSGSVTANPLPGSDGKYALGTVVTLTPQPTSGFVFESWSGDAAGTNHPLQVTMDSNKSVTATFAKRVSFDQLAGTYHGLIQDEARGTATRAGSGFVTIKLTRTGKFSAAVTVGGVKKSVKGTFDSEGGTDPTTINANGLPLYRITFRLDQTNPNGKITGDLDFFGETSVLLAKRAAYDRKGNPAPQTGRYTVMTMPGGGSNGAPDFPQGRGVGIVNVTETGVVKMTMTLPDSAKFACSAGIAADGEWPCFGLLYRKHGFTAGWITFASVPDQSDGKGSLDWQKPFLGDNYFGQGFKGQCELLFSRYEYKKGTMVLSFAQGQDNAQFSVYGGDLPRLPVERLLTLDAKGRVTDLLGDKFKMKIMQNSGLFTGTFPDPQSGSARKFRGVLFQRQNSGVGWYEGNRSTGGVLFDAAR